MNSEAALHLMVEKGWSPLDFQIFKLLTPCFQKRKTKAETI